VISTATFESEGPGGGDATSVDAELVTPAGVTMLCTGVVDEKGTFAFSRILPGTYVLRLIDAEGNSIGYQTIKTKSGLLKVTAP
jgi:hypothetical protein